MTNRKHRTSGHPIIEYFLLAIFVNIFVALGSSLDAALGGFIPGYVTEMNVGGKSTEVASGIMAALGGLIAAGLYKLRFRRVFEGCLVKDGLKTGLMMLAPFLILHYLGSVVSWFSFGTSSVLIAFLTAFAPGFGEELAFRGPGIANYMHKIRDEKQIPLIFWLSSAVFGLAHLLNALIGGDPVAVAIQSVYAIGVGMLFCAVFLRTGTLWPSILGHLSVDFMEFIRGDLSESGGVMTSIGIGDVITFAAGAFAAVWALRLMNKRYYPEIMEIWARKWNKKEEVLEEYEVKN